MSFETYLHRLEAIADQLDGGTLELDTALSLFEEGVELLRRASEELGVAEARVKSLVEQANGLIGTEEFGD